MAYCKSYIFKVVLLLRCLSNLCSSENICELPNEYMFCSCDTHEPHEETEKVSCFVFGNVKQDSTIWDYFNWKPNIIDLTFNSRTGNELKFVPTETIQMLEKLQIITFRQSKLGILESFTFSKLVSVTHIYLSSNEITELQEKCFYRMHNLIQLELAENNIRKIHPNVFVDLPALQKLYLERNNITKLEANAFQNLQNLNELDLHMNVIRKLERGAFHGLSNLTRLDLFKNRLEMLKAGVFSFLTELIELDISENHISKIEADTFKGLDHLITLNLRNNRIMRLPSRLFIGMLQLMNTDLSNNKLGSVRSTTIEEMERRFEDQFVFNIEGNNLVCECDLWWWTAEYLNKSISPEWKKQLRNIKCQDPEDGKIRHRISSLPASEIDCSEMKTATSLITEKISESPSVMLVNEITSSESTSLQTDSSPQTGSSQKHELSDESKEKRERDSMMNSSTDYPVKPDSLATKETVEIQQSSHKRNKNSAHNTCTDLVVMTVVVLLSCFQVYYRK